MKFAHLADAHIGGSREPRLRDMALNAFIAAIDLCIVQKVDFVLFCGDLFNTSMPPVDQLREVAVKLRELKEAEVPFYAIAGSHDYSPSGKTMLDVLEAAGLLLNVAHGEAVGDKLRLHEVRDPKTGVNLVGMIGKKGGLEKEYYPHLDYDHLCGLSSPKIFLFHSSINEMKPVEMAMMDGMAASYLPSGFDYYAGGHVHVVDSTNVAGRNNIVYPGPLFPNSYSELEKLGNGGFYIVEDFVKRYVPIILHPVHCMNVDCKNRTPSEVEGLIVYPSSLNDTIVLLRLSGTLISGRTSDVPSRQIHDKLTSLGAYVVLTNTHQLKGPEIEKIAVSTGGIEDIEGKVILENVKGTVFGVEKENALVQGLIGALSSEKNEGETKDTYERRLLSDCQELWKTGP